MTLLLDSNAFITPALTYYSFDICGGYWDWLIEAAADGKIASIEAVKRELRDKDDQLRHWIDYYASSIFLPDTAAASNSLGQVATWATSNGYTQNAESEFLAKADYQLVARAHHEDFQVVTLETSEPLRKNRIKIPDACNAHGVSSITPYEMLRQNGVRL